MSISTVAVVSMFDESSVSIRAQKRSRTAFSMRGVISMLGVILLMMPVGVSAMTIAPSDDYGTGSGSMYCPSLTSTFQRGARDATTNGQVTELQNFLGDYFDLDDSVILSGFFGKTTQRYVVQFQQQQGLPAYGIIGSMTRAKIAEVCGGGVTEGPNTGTLRVMWNGKDIFEPLPNVTYERAQKVCGGAYIPNRQCLWNGTNVVPLSLPDGLVKNIVIHAPAPNATLDKSVLGNGKTSFSFTDPSGATGANYFVYFVKYRDANTIEDVIRVPFDLFGCYGAECNGDIDISGLPNGNYYPGVTNIVSGIGGSVGAYVYVVGGSPSTASPNIRIITPNGGEQIENPNAISVSWKMPQQFPGNARVCLNILNANGTTYFLNVAGANPHDGCVEAAKQGITSVTGGSASPLPVGSYKVLVMLKAPNSDGKDGQIIDQDESDRSFEVVSSSPTTPPAITKFESDKSSVPYMQPVTISVVAKNATQCTMTSYEPSTNVKKSDFPFIGQNYNGTQVEGGWNFTPTQTLRYTLTCTNAQGVKDERSITVQVTAAEGLPVREQVLSIEADVLGGSITDASPAQHKVSPSSSASPAVTNVEKVSGAGAVSFNGSSYLQSPASADWDFKDDFSIDVWIYPQQGGKTQGIIGHNGWAVDYMGAGGWDLRLTDSNAPSFATYDSAGGVASQVTGHPISLNIWHRIEVVRSGAQLSIIVDDGPPTSVPFAPRYVRIPAQSLEIGAIRHHAANGAPTFMFKGYMDSIRITKKSAPVSALVEKHDMIALAHESRGAVLGVSTTYDAQHPAAQTAAAGASDEVLVGQAIDILEQILKVLDR